MVRDDRDLLLEFPCHSHKRLCFGSLFDNWFFRRGRSRLILKFHPDLQQFFKTRVVRCCNRACIVIFRWIRERTLSMASANFFSARFFLNLSSFSCFASRCACGLHIPNATCFSVKEGISSKGCAFGQLLRKNLFPQLILQGLNYLSVVPVYGALC